ncbi:MAG TPA: NAD(P)/FAD-dependent oxidoreductase [Stellaceae bacterium]|nr:NAD(P)/FAD-dependent oxidoreductase [Stellaceae bacterium]
MPPRLVVVGGGFGGLNVVKSLAGLPVDITLIDRTNHHLFQPLLYQVATAALAPSDIAYPTRSLFAGQRNVTVLMGEVTGVDPIRRVVSVRDTGEIGYDYLVLAIGSVYSWFGHDEWATHATVLKTLDDAITLRVRLLGAFERAESRTEPREIDRLLTFVVIGGGPTGVELVGAIAELARSTLARDFRRIHPGSARILLCEAGPRLLGTFPEALSEYAADKLRQLGVDVRLGAAVEKIDAEGIVVAGNAGACERIASASVFWCAGTAARPVATWLGAPAARNGAVQVEPDCSVPGHPDIFAVGDVTSFTTNDGRTLPGLAPVAKQQGKYVGQLIARRIAGQPPPGPFVYHDAGALAMIGRSSAVADFGFVRLRGVLGWLLWSAVHLLLLVGFRNRLAVYLNWSWAWLTWGRGARLVTRPDDLGTFHFDRGDD